MIRLDCCNVVEVECLVRRRKQSFSSKVSVEVKGSPVITKYRSFSSKFPQAHLTICELIKSLIIKTIIMWIIFYFGLLLLNIIICQWILKHLKLRKALKGIPAPKFLPIIGFSQEFLKCPSEDRFKWFNDLCYQFNNGMLLIWKGLEPGVIIRKPRQMEVVLSNRKLLTKSNGYKNFEPWLGKGLITSTGETWQKHRRIITPTFHFNALENYANVMHKNLEVLTNIIETRLQKNPNAPINIYRLITNYALDVISEASTGVNVHSQLGSDNIYAQKIKKYSELNIERFMRPWLTSDIIFSMTKLGQEARNAVKTMHNYTRKIIKQKLAERQNEICASNDADTNYDENGKRYPKRFLDILMDHYEEVNHTLSFKEVLDELETFMFAGHDTTAAAISWSLFALGNAPEIQKKIRDELNEVLDNPCEQVTSKHLAQLEYFNRVVKEILRLYPSVPEISRELDEETIFDNCIIPKGTWISIQIYQLHHDPEVWEDPETFNPDRFLPENNAQRHPYAYVPFSAGPRNCIGQKFAILEIKHTLLGILQKWNISSVLKPHEMKLKSEIILKPFDGNIDVHFTPLEYIIS